MIRIFAVRVDFEFLSSAGETFRIDCVKFGVVESTVHGWDEAPEKL